ncbi:MAG: C-GCAxxG-C-C family protein [Clostridiales bacterium]|jgi:C_GCAxxG_C_C family probable redox protein|nr:C-GCAxxG-C-C family protein [Clostridiales bacterium]
MREQSMMHYRRGLNCSQAIIKAAEQRYRIKVPQQSYDMCRGVGNGFGSGNICCALVGGIMIFGILFGESATKSLRIKLLDRFHQLHGTIFCGALTRNGSNNSGCEAIVGDVAGLIEEIIDQQLAKL